GHEILLGVRDPQSESVRALLASIGANARAGGVGEAGAFGEVVVLAVPSPALAEVLPQLGPLSGKVLIDATNRVPPRPTPGATAIPSAAPMESMPSVAEEVARAVPDARVVKAFNTLGAELLHDLRFGSENASAFICGDDEAAKAIVTRLAEELGFD